LEEEWDVEEYSLDGYTAGHTAEHHRGSRVLLEKMEWHDRGNSPMLGAEE